MKTCLLFSLLFFVSFLSSAQNDNRQVFEASDEYPYGQPNPEAPEQLSDFQPLIGTCDCKSLRRNPDSTWPDTTTMVWAFNYILNGTAIQDHTWHDNFYATSVRQIQPDSNLWVVTYNSFPGVSTTNVPWLGKKEGDDIVLNKAQKAPNGMDGFSRLTFTNISEKGFHWRGEWVNDAQGIVYPFWLIWCKKRE